MSIEKAYQILFLTALIWFAFLIFAMLVRSVMGPRITDRLLSINMIGTMVISCIVILSRLSGEAYLVDVALIYAMISFISVLVMAMIYIPSGKRRARFSEDALLEYRLEKEKTAGYQRAKDGEKAENITGAEGMADDEAERKAEGMADDETEGKAAGTYGTKGKAAGTCEAETGSDGASSEEEG